MKRTFLSMLLLFVVAGVSLAQYEMQSSAMIPVAPYKTSEHALFLPLPPADTVNGTWSQIAPYFQASFGTYGHWWPDSNGVFVGGGSDGFNSSTYFALYKPASNTYTVKQSPPTGRALNKMRRIKNKLYLAAMVGAWPTPDGATYEYDPVANTWAVKAVMNAPVVQEAGTFVWNDSLLFIIGGSTSGFWPGVSTVRYYNPSNNTWTNCPTPFIFGPINLTSAECIGNQVVVVGGYNGAGALNFTWRGTVIPGATMDIQWRNAGPAPVQGNNGSPYRTSAGVIGNYALFGPAQTLTPTGISGRLWGFLITDSTWRRYLPDMSPAMGNIHNIATWSAADSIRFFTFAGYTTVGQNTCWKYAYKAPTVIFPQSTLCRNGLNKPINDHQFTYDTLNVALGTNCIVRDVNVRIDTVFHTFDSDLKFYLRKGSTWVLIINRVGAGGDNFIGTILNDSATTPIANGSPPFTGSFIPSNPLTPFNNQPTDGQWVLAISDTATIDTGMLKAWCLVITYDCPTGGIKTVEIPNYYRLEQNYPNPFNPTTTISFALPKADNVKLVVYDVLGREVRTLVNEFKQAGIYKVPFDASSFASGVYFYRLETKDFKQTKKMLLVK